METEPQPKQLKKYSLLFLKIAGGVVLFIVVAGIIITAIFGNDIKQLVVNEINKQLVTQVKVSGAIDFSVFKNFPYASITFNKVEIKESVPGSNNNLLKTEKVAALFNVLDICFGNYAIKKIIIGKGDLNITVDENGEPNYNIFKKPDSADTTKFSIKIDKIVFTGLNVQYLNNKTRQLYQFDFHKGTLSGMFGSSEFSLSLNSSFLCRHLFINTKDFITAKEIELNSTFVINTDNKVYKINKADVTIQGVPIKADGEMQDKPESTYLNFVFTGNKLGLESFAGILPPQYGKYLEEFHTEGKLTFNGTIKGDISSTGDPDVSFHFGIKNGSIKQDKMNTSFENVNLDAVYSNGTNHNLRTSVVGVNNGQATFKGKPLSVSFELKDFIKPFISVKVNTSLDLKEIFPMLHLKDVDEIAGELVLNNCYYSGYVSKMNSSIDLGSTDAGGVITISNGSIVTQRSTLQNINGSFTLDKNLFNIDKLSLTGGNSDLSISGNVNNLIPYLLAVAADSTKRMPINIDLTVNSNHLNWEELLKPQANKETNTPPSANVIPATFDVLNGKIAVNINHFTYDKFKGDNIHGNIIFTPDNIFFNNITLSAENGNAVANGTLNKSNKNAVTLQSSFAINNIDITRLFYECNNWGQSEITDKNLKGILNTTFVLNAGWNKAAFDYNQLVVIGDISIDQGELNNYAPLKSLSRFVKISELENVRFSKLENQVEIRNSTINIPTMTVYTNALNMVVSGTHTFDNMIDYNVKLNLLQLLTGKLKSRSFDPEATEKTPEGLLNLFLTMKGPADNPIIKYDKHAVKEKIKTDVAVEKQTLKQTLQQEFKSQAQQQNQVQDWKAPPQYEEMQFGDTTQNEEDDNSTNNATSTSATKQKQKNAFDNFKKSLSKNNSGNPK